MEKTNDLNQKQVEITEPITAADKLSAAQRQFAEVLGLDLAQKWSEETTRHGQTRASEHKSKQSR